MCTSKHGECVLQAHDGGNKDRSLVVATEEGHLAGALAPGEGGHAERSPFEVSYELFHHGYLACGIMMESNCAEKCKQGLRTKPQINLLSFSHLIFRLFEVSLRSRFTFVIISRNFGRHVMSFTDFAVSDNSRNFV